MPVRVKASSPSVFCMHVHKTRRRTHTRTHPSGTRHDIAHALAGAMQACHARPLLVFQALLLHRYDEPTTTTTAAAPFPPPPSFIDQILAVASAPPPPAKPTPPLLISRQDALLLLSRVARGYGGLLCAPPARMDRLVHGVVAGALAAKDDQHTRLQGLKVAEELLQWRAAVTGPVGAAGFPPEGGAVLMG